MNSYFGAFKLWGVLNTNLANGSYFLNIFNSYDVSGMSGQKWVSINSGSLNFVTPNKLLVGILFVYGILGTVLSTYLTILAVKQKKIEI